jgi:hypothetical protein
MKELPENAETTPHFHFVSNPQFVENIENPSVPGPSWKHVSIF